MNDGTYTKKEPKPDTIMIERVIKATPSEVFKAWADLDERKQWDVPGDSWVVAEMAQDFREDGVERSKFGPQGDPIAESYGRYLVIEQDSRIVSAGVMRDLHQQKVSSATMLTVDISPEKNGAKLVLIDQSVFLGEGETAEMRRAGWESILDKLEVYHGD